MLRIFISGGSGLPEPKNPTNPNPIILHFSETWTKLNPNLQKTENIWFDSGSEKYKFLGFGLVGFSGSAKPELKEFWTQPITNFHAAL